MCSRVAFQHESGKGEPIVRWRAVPATVVLALLVCTAGCVSQGDAEVAEPGTAEPTGSTAPSTPSLPADWGWPEWLGESDLLEAAAITVVSGSDLEEVKAAFGAVGDPVRPWDASISTPDEYYYVEPWASFAEVPGGVVVVEPNGFVGINPAVLERASSSALAVVVYWNVELDMAVMVGENSAVVGDIYDPAVGGGRLEELAGSLEIPVQPDAVEAVAWGLQAQPALTGIELTPELWQHMSEHASAYRLEPPDWP